MLFAQMGDETVHMPGNTFGLGYRQEFNTYQWSTNARVDQQVTNRWRVSFHENFVTSMLRTSERDRWKDDQEAGLQLSYLFLPKLSFQTQFQSIVFLDKQSGFNNDVRNHYGTLGVVYQPLPNLYTELSAGPKWDSRYSQHDRGTNYGLTLRGSQFDLAGYENSVNFMLGEDRYDRRKNSNIVANVRTNKQFTDNTADSLDVYYTNQRRDNYVSIVGDIESQREDVKGMRNTLYYGMTPSMNMRLNTALEFKNVELLQYGENSEDRRRKRNDQRFSNELAFYLNRKKLNGRLNMLYLIQEQRYDLTVNGRPFSERTAFVTPNNSSSRLMLTGQLSSRFTNRDSTSAYFSISKFQYDTPDTTNFDDRDELRINTRASYSHWFNSTLRFELQASVNLYHMVYIFGERSADNNWNRILLLRPSIEFKPTESFRLHQSFEVLSNYVDYDFEDPNVQTKSFVFRKFAMSDSLEWKVFRRSSFLFDYRLQLEENGQLYWEAWAQNLIADRSKQWFHFMWQFQLKGHLYLTPGYSIYKRVEWRYNNNVTLGTSEKEKSGTYLSHGPILKLHVTPREKLRLFVEATRYRVSVTDQRDYYVNNIDLGLSWLF